LDGGGALACAEPAFDGHARADGDGRERTALGQLREMARRDHQIAAGLEALESYLEKIEC